LLRKKRRSLARLTKIAKQFWWARRTLRHFLSLRKMARSRHTATNMYHVYILLNKAKTRTYTGVTDDVNEWLASHNAGRVKSSSSYRPYAIIHTESFETLIEARQRERFYKSTTGRRRIKEMFFSKPFRRGASLKQHCASSMYSPKVDSGLIQCITSLNDILD